MTRFTRPAKFPRVTGLMVVALLFGASLSLLAQTTPPSAVANRAGDRPNVLIILTDDQRADTVSAMPQLQKWFGELGTEYPNAYVGTPLCCPSRATVMSGRYAHNTGVIDNETHHNLHQASTLQALLGGKGYRTAIVGKYFNNWSLDREPAHFDRWSIFRQGYLRTKWNVDGKEQTIPRYTTDYISARSASILKDFEKKDSAPWLMYVTPSAPHGPYTPAERHRTSPIPALDPPPSFGEDDRSDKPPAVRDRHHAGPAVLDIREGQLRTLMAVDDLVGRLMSRLGSLRERENTLVFFLSDNGYFWGEHGLIDKRMPYTEGITVPFLARWPGHLEAGAQDRRKVSLVDVAPTILAATGTRPHPKFPPDGRSLLDTWDRDRIFVEYFDRASDLSHWASLVTANYQYVEHYDESQKQITFREYYDLNADRFQLTNLLGDTSTSNDPTPSGLAALQAQLQRDRRCRGTSGPSSCP